MKLCYETVLVEEVIMIQGFSKRFVGGYPAAIYSGYLHQKRL